MSQLSFIKQQQNERDEAVMAVCSMRGGQPQRMTGPVAERWHCSWQCDCAGCSRSETTSDGCISRRRDQVQQVGWSVAVQECGTPCTPPLMVVVGH